MTSNDRMAQIGARNENAVLAGIVAEVAEGTGLSPHAITGHHRGINAVEARHLVWWIAHHERGLSLSAISRAAGRDHTTIRHGVRREQERRA